MIKHLCNWNPERDRKKMKEIMTETIPKTNKNH